MARQSKNARKNKGPVVEICKNCGKPVAVSMQVNASGKRKMERLCCKAKAKVV